MKFFVFIFLALLAFATIGLLVMFYVVGKGIRFFRRFSTGDMSDEEFQRMANKYYRRADDSKHHFGDDYFKGSGRKQSGSGEQPYADGQQQQRPRRASADGVTIEDHRNPDRANKKIFARDEGEYVDFTES